jgi:choice-of-anchor B domain-containing protein
MCRYIFTPLFLVAVLFTTTVSAQFNIDFLGQLEYDDQLSNLTGWSDGAGHEYAIVGTEDGTSIVDITDPTDPVEVQFVDGNNSIWREVRTWSHYAYVVTEAGGGLLCIDLSTLPGPVDFNFTDGGVGLNSGHTVFCDENGYVHVFGSNRGVGGDQIFNANIDPMDPPFVGEVEEWYIHDGFVRGDTLWAGNIYDGWFSVWDISDKSSPELMAQQSTPDNFTHNVWLTDDNNFLYSTDEVTNAVVASYDVSDLTDIKELDQFRANPGTNSIPHNTFVRGDFLVTAYYRDGVVITDATHPDNMIKTGEYDTSPLAGNGFNGAWGAWPYLPSGNIIVSDMEQGLFILGPTYVKACYLDGLVTDAGTGAPLFGAEVSFTAVGAIDATTALTGTYMTGTPTAGTYDITFSKLGYLPTTIFGVALSNGVSTTVNAELEALPTYEVSGMVTDLATGSGVPNANVLLANDIYSFEGITDAEGNFTLIGVLEDSYTLYAGKWGYVTNDADFDVTAGDDLSLEIWKGYYDDFIFDQGWTTTTTTDVGLWEKAEPNGTSAGPDYANPELDLGGDYGDECYVTGNKLGGAAGDDDVDNGNVNLLSPVMDLSTFANPVLTYYRWFYNGGGGGTPNDTLKIFVSNGIEEVMVDAITHVGDLSAWVPMQINIEPYLDLTDNMQVRFYTADQSATGHLVEAGVDHFYVYDDVEAAPETAFGSSETTGCAPLTVVFDDASVGAFSWAWEFPGGTPATSTLENPTVVYNVPGTYDVTLTASNDIGSTAVTTTAYVTAELCNSIHDEDLSGLMSLSPNPFFSTTTITLTNTVNAESITLTDITGRELSVIELHNGVNTMAIGTNLSAGVYFINLIKNGVTVGSTKAVKAE